MDIEEVFYSTEYDDNVTVQLADLDYFKLHPGVTWMYMIFLVTSTIIGNIGNPLIIASVLTYRKLRTTANIFVVNLAIADMIVASFVNYFSIVGVVSGYSFFMDKDGLCHFVSFVCIASCLASVLSLGSIAVNRYICICKYHYYNKIYTKLNTAIMCIAIWVFVIAVEMLPLWGVWGANRYDPKTMMCSYNRIKHFSYTLFFVICVVVPLIVVAACYFSIFMHVRKSKKKVTDTKNSTGNKAFKKKIQLAKSLFIIFVVFLFCWFPYTVVALADTKDKWAKPAHLFVITFAHTNSSLNSVIYGFSNPQFREGYAYVLPKCLPCLRYCMKPAAENRNDTMESTKVSVILES